MEPFKFYWDRVNYWAGIKFLVVLIALYMISFWVEFPWYLVGISIVLTWLVVLLGNPKNKVLMVFLYVAGGIVVTLVSNELFDTYWPWLTSRTSCVPTRSMATAVALVHLAFRAIRWSIPMSILPFL